MIYIPHNYQVYAEKFIFETPYCALFMDMGLGKTIITLSAINELMFGDMSVRKVLVIAPKKVAEVVWTDERDKWDHLKHLKMQCVLGTVKERLLALQQKAHIYIINRENVAWIVAHYQSAWPFDMVVVDELSSFKNPASERFKALRMVRPKMARFVGLTGTPTPNGLPDLWSQMYLVDRGERLGNTITAYRNNYLKPLRAKGHIVYKYGVKDDSSEDTIHRKIADVVISMRAKDYLELPDRIEQLHKVKLSKEMMKLYEEFEDTEVLNYYKNVISGEQEQISAVNAATLIGKLMQFTNGAVYKPEVYIDEKKQAREYVTIHDEKLDALGEIIEAANGEPILVFYMFQHDLERIQARFGGKKYEGRSDFEAWNKGEIDLLEAHPASVAYGLNMQAGGRIIVWFNCPYSLELWDQGNARLDRQGQLKPVIVHIVVCPGTVDMDAVRAIQTKKTGQNALMDAVKVRVDKVKEKYQLS